MDNHQEPPHFETPPQLYHPLDRAKREIRLLRILPSPDKAATIYCELETTTLHDAPEYRALSYEWNPPGVAESSARVLVNNQEIKTTSNLRHGLGQLKDGPSFLYWIDALCINQFDKQERGFQVQFMKNIYQQAKQVVIWLGLGQGETLLGMDLIAELANNELFWGEEQARMKWLLQKLDDPLLKSHWDGVMQIFRNTYWSRLWVVQEIVVASPLETPLLCDSKLVLLEHVGLLLKEMRTILLKFPAQRLGKQICNFALVISSIMYHREGWKGLHVISPSYNVSLLQNLVRYYKQECQDPRDKVYALLGISTPVSDIDFPISYTVDVSEVFRNVAKYIIEGSQRLDILLECHRESDSPYSQPSWVPNWGLYRTRNRTIYRYPEGWDASALLVVQGSFSINGVVLKTRGFIVGKIWAMSERFRHSEPPHVLNSFMDWLNFVASTLKSSLLPDRELGTWLRSLVSKLKASRKQAESIPEVDSSLWESVLEALFDAFVKSTVHKTDLEIRCPFDKFRAYCEKLVCDTELPGGNEWPFAGLYDPSTFIRGRRLCSIKFSSDEDGGPINALFGSSDVNSKQTVGLCPSYAKNGDFVAVLRGCQYPLVLRKTGDGEGYQVINCAYVYGFMRGEAAEKFPEVDINLV